MVVLKATLVFIFGPNLKTKTLLRPRPKPNNFLSGSELFSKNLCMKWGPRLKDHKVCCGSQQPLGGLVF